MPIPAPAINSKALRCGWAGLLLSIFCLSGCIPVYRTKDAPPTGQLNPTHSPAQTQDLKFLIFQGDVARIEQLAAQGIDFNIPMQNGEYPLFEAIRLDKPTVISTLVRYGAKLDLKNNRGQTALEQAILANQLKATEALLNLGADPNQQNQSGDTMLYLACKQAAVSPTIVGLLIDHKADYQLASRSGNIPLQALTWGRPLDLQALRGREASKLAHFVRAGFRPALPIDTAGQPSLHQLVEILDNQELLTQIIQAEKLDLNARDPNGWTPLHNAVWRINLEAGLALLALGADPNLETTRPAKEECRMIRQRTSFGEACEYRVFAGSRPLDVRPAIGLRGEWHTLFAAIRKAGGTKSENLQPAPGFTRPKL